MFGLMNDRCVLLMDHVAASAGLLSALLNCFNNKCIYCIAMETKAMYYH